LEYVIVVGVVIVALVAMQVYMKRGIQAVIKVAADELGEQENSETDLRDPHGATLLLSEIETDQFEQKNRAEDATTLEVVDIRATIIEGTSRLSLGYEKGEFTP